MKLIRLEIEGFGPFKDNQVIEFEQFQKDGLFLIEGETGAGKSSILDAITFALYNFTARWEESTANAVHKSVRSHYSSPSDITCVILEFELSTETGLKTFRITRTLGLDNEGTEDPKKQKVTLDEILPDGAVKTIGAKKTEVESQIRRLLRLEPAEFLQVVLLAQGKFQAFLEAGNDERLELIRKLFNTQRFEKVQRKLKVLADEKELAISDLQHKIQTQVLALSQNIESELPSSGEELPWLDTHIEIAAKSATELKVRLESAESLLTHAGDQKQIADLQAELAGLNAQILELKKHDKAIGDIATRVASADRAAKVSGSYQALVTAQTSFDEAAAELNALDPDEKMPRDLVIVKGLLSKANTTMGSLAGALAAELSLPELFKKLEAAKTEVQTADSQLKAIEADIRELSGERKSLKSLAEKLDESRIAFESAQSDVDGFERYQLTKSEVAELKAECDDLRAKAKSSSVRFTDVFNGYKDSQAGLLADGLNTGEECPVCGSTAHPKKARGGSRVSEKDLEEARLQAEGATNALATAEQKYNDTVSRLQLLDEKYSSAKKTALDKVLAASRKAHVASKDAVSRSVAIANMIDGDESELGSAKADATSVLNQTIAALTGAQNEVKSAEKLIGKHLGEFESIQDHRDWLAGQLEQLENLENLVAVKTSAEQILTSAGTALKKQLLTNKFESLESFLDVYLDAEDLENLRFQVTEHTDELKRVAALLGQDKFVGLPKKTVDVEASHAEFDQASTRRDLAKTEFESASARVTIITNAKKVIVDLITKLGSSRATYETYRRLDNSINGKSPNSKQMTLETYFAAAELETILEVANVHLSTMDAGDQFSLMHSDRNLRGAGKAGLGIEVMDAHTSRTRQPTTLSGGETFQVSLAIALGLAQVVSERAGSIQVDTLFIDEGFGTLSGPVLESAMKTLDGLKQGGRMIGLISHVEKMKEEIDAKVIVEKTPRGPSKVSIQV